MCVGEFLYYARLLNMKFIIICYAGKNGTLLSICLAGFYNLLRIVLWLHSIAGIARSFRMCSGFCLLAAMWLIVITRDKYDYCWQQNLLQRTLPLFPPTSICCFPFGVVCLFVSKLINRSRNCSLNHHPYSVERGIGGSEVFPWDFWNLVIIPLWFTSYRLCQMLNVSY